MRKTILLAIAIAAVLALGMGFSYAQTAVPGYSYGQGGWFCPWHSQAMGQRYTGPNAGGWYCPWMGGGMGYGMGMMHRRGMGPGNVYGQTPNAQVQPQEQVAPGQTPGKPLSQEQAKTLVEDYLRNTNNPNLKLGAFTDKGDVFEADITTKDGSLADKIQVDKKTGWFRSAY